MEPNSSGACCMSSSSRPQNPAPEARPPVHSRARPCRRPDRWVLVIRRPRQLSDAHLQMMCIGGLIVARLRRTHRTLFAGKSGVAGRGSRIDRAQINANLDVRQVWSRCVEAEPESTVFGLWHREPLVRMCGWRGAHPRPRTASSARSVPARSSIVSSGGQLSGSGSGHATEAGGGAGFT